MADAIVMGVSGCGKTSVGEAVAIAAGAEFIEGDALHPAANVEKMSAGIPLTDGDRWPWLDIVGASVASHSPAVASCSALKRAYRDRLRSAVGRQLLFVFLRVDRNELESRMIARRNHFMPASLLDSQLATLEDPAGEPGVLTVDGARPTGSIVTEVIAWFAEQETEALK